MNARKWRTFASFLLVVVATLSAFAATIGLAMTWLPAFFPDAAPLAASLQKSFAGAGPEDYAQIIGAAFLLPTIYVAWRSLSENERIAFLNTRATVILHCANRYDQLYQDRSAAGIDKYDGRADYNDPSLVSVRRYFRRYWGLQSDQMDFYMADWVDPDTIRSWVFSLCEAVRERRDDAPTNFSKLMRKGWDQISVYHRNVNPVFAEMVDLILEFAPQAADHAASLRLTDALLLEIERSTVDHREMTQRAYSMREYLTQNHRAPTRRVDKRRVERALKG